MALPAVLDWSRPSWISLVRHGALLLFLAGLPFFVIALADPYTSLTREDVSFPGRRIARDDRRLVEHDGALSRRRT